MGGQRDGCPLPARRPGAGGPLGLVSGGAGAGATLPAPSRALGCRTHEAGLGRGRTNVGPGLGWGELAGHRGTARASVLGFLRQARQRGGTGRARALLPCAGLCPLGHRGRDPQLTARERWRRARGTRWRRARGTKWRRRAARP